MKNEILTRVVDCLAAVTRYPAHLLTVDADLENDLGIDSVKRVEIILALADQFEVELLVEESDPSIRTVGQIADWVEGVLDREATAQDPPEAPPAPASPPNGRIRTHAGHTAAPRIPPPPHIAINAVNSVSRTSSMNGVNGASPVNGPSPVNGTGAASTGVAKPLEGRVALVTGSGRGIGRTIARLLAARGATVVVNSFHSRDQGEQTVAEIVAQGGTAVHSWGSVANPEHVVRIFQDIEQQFGHLDILVCNASDGKIGSFSELTREDWDRAFHTNVSGHHQCAVLGAELMRPRGGGSIVTMSAVGAHGFINGLGSQGVVKAAVEVLTRYLACELGRQGVRVNCVAGGPVYGDLLTKFPASQTTQNHWESMTPDGELCSPMDLAETIGFLVSDVARGINGAVWMVDHGFSANADGQPLQNVLRQAAVLPS